MRAAIAPMRLVFNTQTGAIERYLGRVPPELEGAAFDAVVDYEFVAAVFR